MSIRATCTLFLGMMTITDANKHLANIQSSARVTSKVFKHRKHLKCKCNKCKHIWGATWAHLSRGHGCPRCAVVRNHNLTRPNMQLIKQKLRGINPTVEILDKDYKSSVHKMKCKCIKCNTIWRVRWVDLRYRHGCPKCYRRSRFLTLDEITRRLMHLNQTIRILSKKYDGSLSPLKCLCTICNNTWETTWNCLKDGYGCPYCNRNGGVKERELLRFASKLCGFKLTPKTPSQVPWLRGLFLDGYNEEHKTAIEYQGEQHYKPIWGLQNLLSTKKRDERKRLLCYRHGVKLVRIPYWMMRGVDWMGEVGQFILKRLSNCKVASNACR